MTRRLHVLQTPFARAMLAQAAMVAAAEISVMRGAPSSNMHPVVPPAQPTPPPPAPPPMVRMVRIDDDGLRLLNEARAKRGKRNAKRAENARRAAEGQRR